MMIISYIALYITGMLTNTFVCIWLEDNYNLELKYWRAVLCSLAFLLLVPLIMIYEKRNT